ncbi:hypothetical protein LINPERPRIM_LOCUS11697 [Linum perenne]
MGVWPRIPSLIITQKVPPAEALRRGIRCSDLQRTTVLIHQSS